MQGNRTPLYWDGTRNPSPLRPSAAASVVAWGPRLSRGALLMSPRPAAAQPKPGVQRPHLCTQGSAKFFLWPETHRWVKARNLAVKVHIKASCHPWAILEASLPLTPGSNLVQSYSSTSWVGHPH